MDFDVRVIPVDSSIILTLVAIIILYFGLKKLLYEPVNNFLEERKKGISDDMENAKQSKIEAEELKIEYETKMREAREQSQKILDDSRVRSRELRDELMNEAREEAASIKERARRDIERERAVAFESLKSETADIAVLIASKIMEENINVDSQSQLIDKFIDEVGSSPWQN